MSYFPDWRQETDKLNECDRAYIAGYRAAIEDAKCVYDNLDMYILSVEEEKVLTEFAECFDHWMESQEIQTVVSLFDNADYLGEDVELKDANPPLYTGTRGAKVADK